MDTRIGSSLLSFIRPRKASCLSKRRYKAPPLSIRRDTSEDKYVFSTSLRLSAKFIINASKNCLFFIRAFKSVMGLW